MSAGFPDLSAVVRRPELLEEWLDVFRGLDRVYLHAESRGRIAVTRSTNGQESGGSQSVCGTPQEDHSCVFAPFAKQNQLGSFAALSLQLVTALMRDSAPNPLPESKKKTQNPPLPKAPPPTTRVTPRITVPTSMFRPRCTHRRVLDAWSAECSRIATRLQRVSNHVHRVLLAYVMEFSEILAGVRGGALEESKLRTRLKKLLRQNEKLGGLAYVCDKMVNQLEKVGRKIAKLTVQLHAVEARIENHKERVQEQVFNAPQPPTSSTTTPTTTPTTITDNNNNNNNNNSNNNNNNNNNNNQNYQNKNAASRSPSSPSTPNSSQQPKWRSRLKSLFSKRKPASNIDDVARHRLQGQRRQLERAQSERIQLCKSLARQRTEMTSLQCSVSFLKCMSQLCTPCDDYEQLWRPFAAAFSTIHKVLAWWDAREHRPVTCDESVPVSCWIMLEDKRCLQYLRAWRSQMLVLNTHSTHCVKLLRAVQSAYCSVHILNKLQAWVALNAF